MDNPFFTALEGDGFDASTLAKQTNSVLMPFMRYLNNSIKALENKEVSCHWKPISKVSYRLKPDKSIWHFFPITEIDVVNDKKGWFEILSEGDETPLDEHFSPDIDDPVIVGKGADRQRFSLNNDQFRKSNTCHEIYLPELKDNTVIQWSGYQLSVRPLAVALEQLSSVHVNGHKCKVVSQLGSKLKVEGLVTAESNITVEGASINFKMIDAKRASIPLKYQAKLEGNGWLLFSGVEPSISSGVVKDVTQNRLSSLSLSHFLFDDRPLNTEQWSISKGKDELILVSRDNESLSKNCRVTCYQLPGIRFSIEAKSDEEKWLQLIEKSGGGQDQAKSDLDYFFSDNQNIKLLDSSQGKHHEGFRVLKSRPEERQILLAKNIKGEKNWKSEYPANKGKNELRVSVDTSQLRRQKEAINQLKNRPNIGHKPLIHLLQSRSEKHWQNVELPEIGDHDWHVLKNPDFDGCIRQRDFVKKALASEDFSILDGPPGTGKTTSILELIIQLVLQGKRVLLTASTHAAINNVLERIKESPGLSEHIFPLRIGYESNSIGVEEYHFDKQLELLKSIEACTDLSKQLLVDSSNLVCGTTNGILKLFREDGVSLDRAEPPFDVMIIDECSKTTFHEFLVPARFAKRWVLVGDVRQLSPFTDREQIVANLDNLMLEPSLGGKPEKKLSSELQQACFLLEELRGGRNPYKQPMLVPVTINILAAIEGEINVRKKEQELSRGLESILLIAKSTKSNRTSGCLQNLVSIKKSPTPLYSNNLCFIEESILNDIQHLIPDDMLVLHKHWQYTQQAMEHKYSGTLIKPFDVKTKPYTDTVDVHKELLHRLDSTKWSEELCWRLERDYWLRLSADNKGKTRKISKTINRLLPKSVDVFGRIHVLKNITFPSILEALSGDGLQKYKKDGVTTLNQGFTLQEKSERHTTLDYQHRMHPDISYFPRKQFYPKGELNDGSQTMKNRSWEYNRYQSHRVWLDVKGEESGNANHAEVRKVIEELEAFCGWAKNKSKENAPYDVAILTFYKGQEKALRHALQKLPGNKDRYARFSYKGIAIKLATVDYFQGQEADLVFLSMVNVNRDGFLDSPNRLNVAVTRARYQLVIVGSNKYFSKSGTVELRNLATLEGRK